MMYLSHDNVGVVEYDIREALGFVANQLSCGYARSGTNLIRVKDHTPDWDYFREEIEDGITTIINITLGDYHNSDKRRNKGKISDLKSDYPFVNIVDIEIVDGEEINLAIQKIKAIIA